MSLIVCPECAHEVSSSATACPNCGHPFAKPVVQPRVVVQEFVEEDSGFPKWAFIPIGILGVVLLFVFFVFLRSGNEEDQRNVNIKIASQPTGNTARDTTVRNDSQPNQVVVPSTSQPDTVMIPPSTSTSQPSTTIVVPPTDTIVESNVGTVNLEAKILSRNSTAPQPVRGTRFYLLKKDAESILRDADIEDESGQSSLLSALGLSVVYPDRYGDFNRKAMSAISKSTAYNVTTDSSGKASLKDVKPDSYYLFAITKTGNGFAIWNSQVSIQPGQNALVLEPARPTEISQQ